MATIIKFSMGATAAIITSMGIISGLAYGRSAKSSIIAGLLIVAIADNISDSLGIHIYKESEGVSRREINSSTYGNFIVRLILVMSFAVIVLLLPSQAAFVVSSIWGLTLLSILSYSIAKTKKTNASLEIIWHLIVAIIVIIGSKFLGSLIYSKIVH
jgi:vacuolar iron transporter family protein